MSGQQPFPLSRAVWVGRDSGKPVPGGRLLDFLRRRGFKGKQSPSKPALFSVILNTEQSQSILDNVVFRFNSSAPPLWQS